MILKERFISLRGTWPWIYIGLHRPPNHNQSPCHRQTSNRRPVLHTANPSPSNNVCLEACTNVVTGTFSTIPLRDIRQLPWTGSSLQTCFNCSISSFLTLILISPHIAHILSVIMTDCVHVSSSNAYCIETQLMSSPSAKSSNPFWKCSLAETYPLLPH